MPKEELPHIPGTLTTPEMLLEKQELKGKRESKLAPEQLEASVNELMELSAAKAEAGKHIRESWGGLTKAEREELKNKGGEAVAAHFSALELDPELAEFQESALKEYDDRIRELGSNTQVMSAYKEKFEKTKGILAQVFSYEHLSKELDAITGSGQKLRSLYEKIGSAPGPMEKKRMEDLKKHESELKEAIAKFELTPEVIDALHRREIRKMQQNLEKYNFGETESRTELIRELLPDLLQAAPALFQGETGSGKSQLARYICEKYLKPHFKKDPFIFDVNEQIKESQILGSASLKGGETEFEYSPFMKALKGGAPIVINEINNTPHEFATIWHELLQLRSGDFWTHPKTGEKIKIKANSAACLG